MNDLRHASTSPRGAEVSLRGGVHVEKDLTASPAVPALQIVEMAYQALKDAAGYPKVAQELSHEFLLGVDQAALSPPEKAALTLEYEADLRLTALLDQFVTALSSRQARLLVKDKTLYELIGFQDGLRSFTDVRGQRSGKGSRAAVQELQTAQTLAKTPSAQKAVDDGQFTLDHVTVLSKAVASAKARGQEALSASEQEDLVSVGKNRTSEDYQKVVSRYLHGRNPVAHDATQTQIRSRRFFHVTHTPTGAHLKGFIDPIAAQTLQLALEAATPKPSKDDDRSFGQRNADALIDISSLALNTGELKAGALVRPHLSLIMTETTFLGATKELARRAQVTAHNTSHATTQNGAAASQNGTAGQDGAATHTGTAGQDGAAGQDLLTPASLKPVAMEPAEFEDGTPIPLNELTMLLCDSSITRIVLDAQGVPLNAGRTQRLYSKELRRVIIARDRSCRFEGCTMATRWSEIHHIQWWEDHDGETSAKNGILVCKFHHSQIHDGTLHVIHDHHGLPQVVVKPPILRVQDNGQPEPVGPHLEDPQGLWDNHVQISRSGNHHSRSSPNNPSPKIDPKPKAFSNWNPASKPHQTSRLSPVRPSSSALAASTRTVSSRTASSRTASHQAVSDRATSPLKDAALFPSEEAQLSKIRKTSAVTRPYGQASG